jgi:hypothetical protein
MRIAGRATCGSVPITNIPSAIIAPEFPALTTASASPCFISSNATRIEEFFFRTATLGDSCIGHEFRRRHNLDFRPIRVSGELALDNFLIADQNHLDAKFPCGQRRALDHRLRGVVAAHGVNGNSRHRWNALALLDLNYGAAPVKAAVRARTVRPSRFATIGTSAPLRFGESVMRPALVLDPLGSSSFGYGHRFSPIFLRWRAAKVMLRGKRKFSDRL